MSAFEKFVDDLSAVINTAKTQKEENEMLHDQLNKYEERIQGLNDQLREYGKRIAELESRQVESSELKDMVTKLVQEEIEKRKTNDCERIAELKAMACNFDVARSETHDFFYRRLRALGVDIQDLREVLGNDTFVVGRIVLESVLCQNLGSTLPIKILTRDIRKFERFNDTYSCLDGAHNKFTFHKNRKCIFKVRHFKNTDDLEAALEQSDSLDFCRNFFNGNYFVIRDYEAVLGKRHIEYDGMVPGKRSVDFCSYQEFGFKFLNEKKPVVKKVRQQKILSYGEPKIVEQKESLEKFFYGRIEELGLNAERLRNILKEGNTFVTGLIVLESIYGRCFNSSLPIDIFTTDQEVVNMLYGSSYYRTTLINNIGDITGIVQQEALSFCRNYFNGTCFVMADYDAIMSKRHIIYPKQIVHSKSNFFESYKCFGFDSVILESNPENQKPKPCIRQASAPHIIPNEPCIASKNPKCATSPSESLRKGVKCENPIDKSKKPKCATSPSLRKGVKCVNPINKVSAELIRMKDTFNALCAEYGVLSLVKSIIAKHAPTSHNVAFSGNIVSASIIGNAISGGALTITTTMGYDAMYEILRNNGLYFVETLGETGCQASTWSNASVTRVSGATVYLLVTKHADFHGVCRSVREQRGLHCEFNGETFFISDYDKFILKYTQANPNMETRDVYVDCYNVASFPNYASPLTFKLANSVISETNASCSSAIPNEACSSSMTRRTGLKSENRSHAVDIKSQTMIDKFWELCKQAEIDTLMRSIIDKHKETSCSRFTISGNLVLAAIFNTNPVCASFTITTNIPNAVREIVLSDEKRVISGSGTGTYDYATYRHTETNHTIEIIRVFCDFDEKRTIVRVKANDHCEFDGEKFYIHYYDNFMSKFSLANPGIETRDVLVDGNNVATFSGDCDTLAIYKLATMKDYFDKFLNQFCKEGDTIRELLKLPKSVIMGSQVRDAIKGKVSDNSQIHLICFDFIQVLTIMNRCGYGMPGMCELVVRGMPYVATSFKCLSGLGTIHIRIPKDIAHDKQRAFIEYYLHEHYNFDYQCIFDGTKFFEYVFSEMASGVARITKEYTLDSLPIKD